MKQQIIQAEYEGQVMRFNDAGWINATEAAKPFGQEPRDWLRLHDTESYMRALAKHLGLQFEPRMIERNSSGKVSGGKSGFRPELSNCAGLVVAKRGSSSTGGGTWLHPKLAVAFARWLSPEFAVWCDLQIDAIIRGNVEVIDAKRLRHEASSSYKVMSEILHDVRAEIGKDTQGHHYANEARLINRAMTGSAEGQDLELVC
jgi:hypothetical protein